MAILTLHLLRLGPFINVPAFLQLVRSHSATIDLLVAARPRHKVIKPAETDTDLLAPRYELVLLVRRKTPFWPGEVQGSIYRDYSIHIAVPSTLVNDYVRRNAELLAQATSFSSTPSNLPSASERVPADLLAFAERLRKSAHGDQPVTMINLLRFAPDQAGSKDASRKRYAEYGRRFAGLAARCGAAAKVVGKVIEPPQEARGASWGDENRKFEEWWDEVSVVHYPSITAFVELLASEEYGKINKEWRVGALKDTLLLATTEVGEEVLGKL